MQIAIGQINSTIGDFSGNVRKILEFSFRAGKNGAEIIVFPELALCGYPPMDLLEHPDFVRENFTALERLQKELPPSVAVVLGHVSKHSGSATRSLQNSISIFLGGEIVHQQAKTLLPTYDVFDEARYFEPANMQNAWNYKGVKIGICICEDIWWEVEGSFHYTENPVHNLLKQNIDLLLVPSASPFYTGKSEIRRKLINRINREGKIPVVYVNMAGANDSLIFDGRSVVFNDQGKLCAMGAGFQEDLLFCNLTAGSHPGSPGSTINTINASKLEYEKYEEIRQALCLGISDYLAKTGFERVHLGLSGGVDSALVLTLAVQALGPERIRAFMLPSRYSSEGSIKDSLKLCQNLGLTPDTINIDPVYNSFEEALSAQFAGSEAGLAEENLQARIRGNILMAWSNKFNSLLLTTGNKSELGVGYCTLYGDMAGALAVIGDLFKTEVYELCRHINRSKEIIPEEILTKPPSAELRPGQKDQDSLPPYETLDAILKQYFLQGQTVLPTFDPKLVQRIITLVARAEYKRYQAPPVLKISPKAFGVGRRMPIARALYEIED